MRLGIIVSFLLAITTVRAGAVSPEDFQVVETFNRYYFAIQSARICNKQPFKSAEEQRRFQDNFRAVRGEAAKALKRNKPKFSNADIIANIKFMDDQTSSTVENAYAVGGCRSEMIVEGLRWHKGFRLMPKFPKPAR